MFQPFRGIWIQVLGCFLSKDSVTSQILYKHILECLLLLERAGFYVDVVTMDGAQWNRGVWTMLGIRDGHYSCEHPSDTNRRLWMMSDFPHLIKCFRNGFMKPNIASFRRFFGMMRNACGSNDHPDPVLFAQVFRLMCSYSLIKPPKGSNVSGTELLRTLMGSKESLAASQNPKKELFSKLDAVIEGGQFKEPENCSTAIVTERDHDYFETCSNSSRGHLATHDYDVVKTSEEVMAYIAGYIVRKGMRITPCLECRNRLKSEDSCDRDRVIDLMSRFGGLFYPSEELFRLLKTLETAVLDVVGKLTVKENTLHQIVERVAEMESLTLYRRRRVKSLNVDAVIRGGLRRYTDQLVPLWNSLADYYMRSGLFERVRDIYEEAIQTVTKVRDFTQIFDAYAQFEELSLSKRMEEAAKNSNPSEEDDIELELRLARFEHLMERRLLLLNSVLLGQNPYNVQEWHKRMMLYKGQPHEIINTYMEAVQTVQPQLAVGKLHTLWVAFTKFYEENGQIPDARLFLEENNYFEEAFRAYEKGIALFKWANVYDIWNTYLTKFLKRYGGTKLERTHGLFEQCLKHCPPKYGKALYLLYAKLEGEHGLSRHAMSVYERATGAVLDEEKFEIYR